MPKLSLYKLRLLSLIDVEKSELAFYQLRDVAQSCYKVWHDRRVLERGPMTLYLFKMSLLERLFLG